MTVKATNSMSPAQLAATVIGPSKSNDGSRPDRTFTTGRPMTGHGRKLHFIHVAESSHLPICHSIRTFPTGWAFRFHTYGLDCYSISNSLMKPMQLPQATAM